MSTQTLAEAWAQRTFSLPLCLYFSTTHKLEALLSPLTTSGWQVLSRDFPLWDSALVLYCVVLYYTVVLYFIVLYYIVLYCIVSCCIVLYCVALC